jgi:hypothetical protein
MSLLRKTKSVLVRTPLYNPLLAIQSDWQARQIRRTDIRDVRTNYCISPHKTGTTFISQIFDQSVTAHEPLRVSTVRNLSNHDFLRRRKSYLDLRIEASGFLASIAREYGELFPKDNMVFMIRDPSNWIGSVLDYVPVVRARMYTRSDKQYPNLISRHGHSEFFELNEKDQHEYISDMLNFWLKVYRAARDLPNGHIIRLNEADDNIELLEHLFEQKAVNLKTGFRRINEGRKSFSAWNYVNKADFADGIAEFGY